MINSKDFKELLESIKNNTYGTELSFVGKEIDDEQAVILADAFMKPTSRHNTSIKTLMFGFNKLGEKGSLAIAEMLQSEKTGLTEVYLDVIGLTDKGYFAVVKALETNPNLKKLSLSGNILKNIDVVGVLHHALIKNKTLTFLGLAGNTIDATAACFIMQGLEHNKTLTTLDLSSNFIGDVGCRHVARLLRVNDTLREIDLSENWIKLEGGLALTEELQGNTSVTALNLAGNYLDWACDDMLSKLSKTNTTLTHLNLSENYDLSKIPTLKEDIDKFNKRNREIQSIRKDIDRYLCSTASPDAPKLESKEVAEELNRKREIAVAISAQIGALAAKGCPQTIIEDLNEALTKVAGKLMKTKEGEKEQPPALLLSALPVSASSSASVVGAGSVASVKPEDDVSSESKPRRLSLGDRKSS